MQEGVGGGGLQECGELAGIQMDLITCAEIKYFLQIYAPPRPLPQCSTAAHTHTPTHTHTNQHTHTLMALVCGNRRCLCVRLLFVFQIHHTPRIRGAVEINRMRSQKQFQRIYAIQQLKPDIDY